MWCGVTKAAGKLLLEKHENTGNKDHWTCNAVCFGSFCSSGAETQQWESGPMTNTDNSGTGENGGTVGHPVLGAGGAATTTRSAAGRSTRWKKEMTPRAWCSSGLLRSRLCGNSRWTGWGSPRDDPCHNFWGDKIVPGDTSTMWRLGDSKERASTAGYDCSRAVCGGTSSRHHRVGLLLPAGWPGHRCDAVRGSPIGQKSLGGSRNWQWEVDRSLVLKRGSGPHDHHGLLLQSSTHQH